MNPTNRRVVFVSVVLFATLVQVSFTQYVGDGVDTAQDARSKSDEILSNIMQDCVNSQVDSVTTCLKLKVLHYFDYDVSRIASPRSLSDNDVEKIDRLVVKRFQKYLKSRQFEIQLPEFFFQRATLVFNPDKSLADFDVVFPKSSESEDRSMSAARDMMQQKALLPLLMMLKMKLKMITPIMLTLVSIKATKAMLMSKLALLMVTIFMASQLLKKLGMHLPMLHPPPMEMGMAMAAVTTPPSYGAPAPLPPSSSYGPSPPSQSYGSPSSSSYSEPSAASWEPSSASSNTYSKVWDPQQLAYSAYYKSAPSSSSSLSSSSSSSTSSV
ncbi:uncharacterized protein Osi20 [Planococcus citri]|uniref:uncharacterized protein Osi20 n=1 Tax=Planococcus citri TaxID=170843 RepID=UPI0031F91850